MEKELPKDEKLRLLVLKSALELGKSIDKHLCLKYNLDPETNTFIVPIKESWFSDGHQKVEILDTVRKKNMFFLTDIGNYSIEYKMHGFINHTSPNDLLQQLKDAIGACSCHAEDITILMPYLFGGRQHRRKNREALSCAQMLHEFDTQHAVKRIVTTDAHDEGVEMSLFNTEFDNFFATNYILEEFINNLSKEELKHLVFVAPDNGALGRTHVYLNSFDSPYIDRDAGNFFKLRDYNTIVDGKNPIISHEYSGRDNLKGKTALVTDDMISSGGSMLDVIDSLKKKGVEHIYLMATFALFTEGIEKFNEYYEKGLFDGVYTTNLSYVPEEYKKASWCHVCDCSKLLADVIYNLYNDLSISTIKNNKNYPIKMIEKKYSE